jgi:hypothetical protein
MLQVVAGVLVVSRAIIAPPYQGVLVRSTLTLLPACIEQTLADQLRGIAVTNSPLLAGDGGYRHARWTRSRSKLA